MRTGINPNKLRKERLLKTGMPNSDDSCDEQPNSTLDIQELFRNFFNFYQQKDICSMSKIVSALRKLAQREPFHIFPEFMQYNLSKILCLSLTIPNTTLHVKLLQLFCFVFRYHKPQLLVPLLKDGFLVSLMGSIDFDDEQTVFLSLRIIILLTIHSKEVCRQLLQPNCMEIFFQITQEDTYADSIRSEATKILVSLSETDLTEEDIKNLLIYSRQILSDKLLIFLWADSIEILYNIICDLNTSYFVMITQEFAEILNCLLHGPDLKIVGNALSCFNSFFEFCSHRIEIDYGIIVSLCLCEDKEISQTALQTCDNIIKDKMIDELLEFNFFGVIKEISESGSFQNKSLAVKIMSDIIRNCSMEIIIGTIDYNFIESLVAMFELDDFKLFNHAIGVITKLLRRTIEYDPRDIFWCQFESSGGVEILENLSYDKAHLFLDTIYKFRP